MRLALLLLLIPATALANTDVSFELLDRGDSVEVIAHNVKASRTAVSPIRQRLEVTVVGRPYAAGKVPTDANVKVIEFDMGAEPRVLSVKLNYERADVKALARFAQAIQVGDDLHVMFPRKLPAEGTIVKLPDPTMPAIVKATDVKLDVKTDAKVDPKNAVKIDPKIDATKVDPKLDATKIDPKNVVASAKLDDIDDDTKLDTAKIEAKPTPKLAAKAEPKATLAPAPENDGWTKLSTYGAIGLGAAGLGAWLLKKRRAPAVATSTIDIIAQRALGGKAKIVWFTAGGREMVVAVTQNSVRLLGQWPKDAAHDAPMFAEPTALPEATALPEMPRISRTMSRTSLEREVAAARHTRPDIGVDAASPTVTGILKLRAQTVQPIDLRVSDEVATGDTEADEVWARELLAAGSRR